MPVSEILARLESRLRRARAHWVLRRLTAGAVRGLATAGAAALLAVGAGALLAGAPHAYLPLAVAAALALAAALVGFVVVPWARRPDLRRFARLAESRLPELRSLLVNALELAPVATGAGRAPGGASRELAAAVLAQAEERARLADLGALAPRAVPRAWGRALAAVAALWAAALLVAPGPMGRSAWALLHPGAAHAAAVALAVWPGDVTLAPGATLTVGGRVRGADEAPVLVFRSRGGERRERMAPAAAGAVPESGGAAARGGRAYEAAVAAVSAPGEYFVTAAGRHSPVYRVTLSGSATPVAFEITHRYPAYTRLPAETQAATRADLVALRGTRATVALDLDRSADAVTWTLGSAWRADGPRRWVAETTVLRDGPYEIEVRAAGRAERFAFRTEAVADRPPLLSVALPAGDLDLPAGQRVDVAVAASDDFGLTDLTLVYEREDGPGGRVPLAAWPDEPRDAAARAAWDVSPLGLLPGQSAAFVLEVRDNDRVSGPKTTRSARFVVRFPTLSEVYEGLEEKQASAAERMEKALADARELAKQVEAARRDLQPDPRDRRGEAAWEKRQAAKAAAERQAEISQKLQEVTQQLEEATRQAAEHQAFREDILEKMQEISKLVAELQSPELKDAIRKLQESLREVDPRKLEANLRQLQNAQDELLQNLERTLELLKRIRQEEKLAAAARRAEDLAQRETELEERLEPARSAEERERLAAAQEQLARESEALQQDLEELTRDLAESGDRKTAGETQQSAETLAQEAQPALQQSAGEMRQSQNAKARQSASRARQALSQVAQRLARAEEEMSQEGQRRLAEAVRRSAQDLVALSQRQEQALAEGGETRRRAQRQQDLREGAERVADDLVDLGKQTPFLPPDAQRALGEALRRLDRAEQSFGVGQEEQGEAEGRGASAAFNQTVVVLRDAEQSMCQGGQNSGGRSDDKQQPGAEMQGLTGQQQSLNQDTQSLIDRLTQQQRLAAGDQATLEQLAARQEAIRRGLEEAQAKQDEGDALGRLEEAKRDMEEVARSLREQRLDGEVSERQNRILSRLLDAQRSVNRREFDERRESRPGEEALRPPPPELPAALTDGRERTQRDLLRARAERYPAEYRDQVESYLRRLQESR